MPFEPSISITLESPEGDLSPNRVDVKDLLSLFGKLRDAIYHCAVDTTVIGEAPSATEPILCLTAIDVGSIKATCSAGPRAWEGMRRVARALSRGNVGPLPRLSQEKLLEFSKQIVDRGYIAKLSGTGIDSSIVSEKQPIRRPGKRYVVRGETVLYGRLIRLGGMRQPRIEIKPIGKDKAIKVIATKNECRQLAADNQLYGVVGLVGTAEWDAKTMELVRFKFKRLSPYRETDIATAFENLRRAAAGRWDNINPGNLVRDLRSDDEDVQ